MGRAYDFGMTALKYLITVILGTLVYVMLYCYFLGGSN